MKLVLIQGNVLARYEGRKQGQVATIDWADNTYDVREVVEDFRVNGVPQEPQLDQA